LYGLLDQNTQRKKVNEYMNHKEILHKTATDVDLVAYSTDTKLVMQMGRYGGILEAKFKMYHYN